MVLAIRAIKSRVKTVRNPIDSGEARDSAAVLFAARRTISAIYGDNRADIDNRL